MNYYSDRKRYDRESIECVAVDIEKTRGPTHGEEREKGRNLPFFIHISRTCDNVLFPKKMLIR